ncbi:MAG: histidinol-phosphate transaminase [Candidatus Tectomicrobia bacterium RIFCSPLOWO2_12_FULL_69_37]|nr:MAG: histidinol-phosphate transaminase [Candidatus Tectomicrobia bacterium RIFCSPLOWO2_02_FULL_70_19]OGL65686.1 MAG: histidinol-phosphate transaminase [Candidatus Tectomicrobia bacterium RIFCSPLOWO2_12_FULL_69_37]
MALDPKALLRKGVDSLTPYVPGRTTEEVARAHGLDASGIVKLASNENALGPSPAALRALQGALGKLHRYPDSAARGLRAKLAGRLGVKPGQVFVGNGGDDVLSVLARTFLNEGEEAVIPAPTFSPYAHVSRVMGARVVTSPLRDFRIDLGDVRARVTERTKLVFLCSPNNPTGAIVPGRELVPFLEGLPPRVLVLLDEAYGDFVEDPEFPDSIALARRHPLIVLRSFSKIYGLAGLRVGFGVGDEGLIGYMDRVREPFNVNLLAQIAAEAALDDEAFRRRAVEAVREGRRKLYAAFRRMELDCLESQANFIFVRVGDGDGVFEALMRQGVIVRPGSVFGCPEWVRVTMGLPEEDERLLLALRQALA